MRIRRLLSAACVFAAFAASGGDGALDSWLRGLYGCVDYETYALVDRAARTLEANALGRRLQRKLPEGEFATHALEPPAWSPLRAIQPSEKHFVGFWNWDGAFAAVGASWFDPELARDQFRVLRHLQRADGFLGDVLGVDGRVLSNWGKPPVAAWAFAVVHRRCPDRAFLAETYPFLKRHVLSYDRVRRCANGLYRYDADNAPDEATHRKWAGWESGWDNSPRWDGNAWNVCAVDLNCWLVLADRALAAFAEELGLAADAADWKRRETELASRVERELWDAEAGCYYDWNWASNRFSRILTPASFMPLFAGIASREHAARMAAVATRLSPGWPSVSYDDPAFDPLQYWRGRTWINIAYFAIRGLKDYGFDDIADRGRARLLEMLRGDGSSIYENYHPVTGVPLGVPRFSWSCAFALELALDWARTKEPTGGAQ